MEEYTAVHQIFERQAAFAPDAPALLIGGRNLTFRELNRRANFMAARLQEAGAAPEVIVGLFLERSEDLIVALLAILKAGAAYCPLDPALPAARLDFILRDTQSPLLLTQPSLRHALPEFTGQIVVMETGEEARNPVSRTTPDTLMFVLYTSGSTGTPKGVLGLHRGASALCTWSYPGMPSEENGVFCFARSLNFIGGFFDIFRPLMTGRPLILLTEEERKDARLLTQIVAQHGVTRLSITPSLLRSMIEAYPDLDRRLRSVEICLVSGEPLSVELCRRFLTALPNRPIFNTYGATEVTGVATIFDARSLTPDAATVPIGKPVEGVQIHILDGEGQAVPEGEAGEIAIGGPGVTRGYLNQPALSAERFAADPFRAESGARLFLAGDRGRRRPDGVIEYLGRADHQVQIRGFRIELGEIEAALTRHPQVQAAVVVMRAERSDDPCLVAYAVPTAESALTVPQLRVFLKESLPDYMLPAAIVLLAQMPLNTSGKIDRAALPPPINIRMEGTESALSSPQTQETLGAPDTEATHDTEITAALTALWSRILDLETVGVQDNFFDLGGHSLRAIRLLTEIERAFGVRLSLGSMLLAPTIRQMSEIVRCERDEGRPAWSPLVPLQTRGSRPPLFCAPVSGGSAFYYHPLAAQIGPDQPLYTLEPRGMIGTLEPHETIEEMAGYYVEHIRTVQPTGPYYLCGLSFGGQIAFEMARQLQAAGEEIGLLALFDSWAPGHPHRRPITPLRARLAPVQKMVRRLSFHWVKWCVYPTHSERLQYIQVRFQARIGKRRPVELRSSDNPGSAATQDSAADSILPEHYQKQMQAEKRARAVYRPQSYPGRIHQFKARMREPEFKDTQSLGWQPLAQGGIEEITMPGTHHSLLNKPFVSLVVAQLHRLLAEAQDR